MNQRKKHRLSDQFLGVLDKAAARDDFEGFQTAEYLLVCLHAPGAEYITAAQAKMAPADVARWQAARSAMFAKVVTRIPAGRS